MLEEINIDVNFCNLPLIHGIDFRHVISAKLKAQREKEEQRRLAEQRIKEREAEEVAQNAGQFSLYLNV